LTIPSGSCLFCAIRYETDDSLEEIDHYPIEDDLPQQEPHSPEAAN